MNLHVFTGEATRWLLKGLQMIQGSSCQLYLLLFMIFISTMKWQGHNSVERNW